MEAQGLCNPSSLMSDAPSCSHRGSPTCRASKPPASAARHRVLMLARQEAKRVQQATRQLLPPRRLSYHPQLLHSGHAKGHPCQAGCIKLPRLNSHTSHLVTPTGRALCHLSPPSSTSPLPVPPLPCYLSSQPSCRAGFTAP